MSLEDQGQNQPPMIEIKPNINELLSNIDEEVHGLGSRETVELTLLDPDVLDCPICYETFSIPVYQCTNGHVFCSSCYVKTIPSCSAENVNIRSLAFENFLRLVEGFCQIGSMAATRSFFAAKNVSVNFFPSLCPLPHCMFKGSIIQLATHFRVSHCYQGGIGSFDYDQKSIIVLDVNEKYKVLQERRVKSLFILHNRFENNGNGFSVSYIGQSHIKEGFRYGLVLQINSTSGRLKSVTDVIQALPSDDPPLIFFVQTEP